MAYNDVNQSVLSIVNVCLGRLGLATVATLDETSLSLAAVELLNDVMADLSTFANWPQLYAEGSVAAEASVAEYKLNFDAKCISEVAVSGQISPMNVVTIEDIRRMNRLGNVGTPRQFAIIRVSGNASYMREIGRASCRERVSSPV